MYLNQIITYKKKEILEQKALYPVKLLEQSIYFDGPSVSLSSFLKRKDKQGIIAEFKRKSPSKGAINPYASVEKVSIGYMQAGASALSVLTDEVFFGGSYQDLTEARTFNYAPILNKNFILDEYQIIKAKAAGADVILLIAECLTKTEVLNLSKTANSLGMEVLLEMHTADQLDKLCDTVQLVGINNRDLKTFEVNIDRSLALGNQIPSDFIKVAESGIQQPETVMLFKAEGFEGFLMGEHFMREAQPELACAAFHKALHQLQNLEKENALCV